MNIMEFREYCLSLPMVEESTPFDEFVLILRNNVTPKALRLSILERLQASGFFDR